MIAIYINKLFISSYYLFNFKKKTLLIKIKIYVYFILDLLLT